MRRSIAVVFIAILWTAVSVRSAESRDEKVRSDRQTIADFGFWIYNDLPKGIEESKRTGKPLLVVFRCVP
jgi:serine protease Do